MTQPSTNTNRLLALDGLRGLAILLVMIFHVFQVAMPLSKNPFLAFLTRSAEIGWVGVDIFFVLSGFLITAILLNTRDQPHYFKYFYARRILRIFPLYFLIIGGIFVFFTILEPKTNPAAQQSWLYYVFYLQNWLFIPLLNREPVSVLAGPSWSLALEEQFYLVWPALVFFVSRRWLVFVSIAILIFSLAARLLFFQFGGPVYASPEFLYFSSVTRFDGFAVGALIALAFQGERWKQIFSRFAWVLLVVSLAALVAIIHQSGNMAPLKRDYFLNTWGYSLIALAAGALIVMLITIREQTIISMFFRNRILLFFGKHSYAMYLIHVPVMMFLLDSMDMTRRNSVRAWLMFVSLNFVLTILGSVLTWYMIEKPILALKKYFEYQRTENISQVKPINDSN